jgi:hypothetical protein
MVIFWTKESPIRSTNQEVAVTFSPAKALPASSEFEPHCLRRKLLLLLLLFLILAVLPITIGTGNYRPYGF